MQSRLQIYKVGGELLRRKRRIQTDGHVKIVLKTHGQIDILQSKAYLF